MNKEEMEVNQYNCDSICFNNGMSENCSVNCEVFKKGYCKEYLPFVENLQKQLDEERNKNKKAIEYIKENQQKSYRTPMSDDYECWNELSDNELKDLLEILGSDE